jgi:hypothetical protein
MAKHFYIYALIDPRDLKPYYIGKGSGDRKVQHFRGLPPQDKIEGSSPKHQRINEIKEAGLLPSAIVLSSHTDEGEALKAEQAAIANVGIDTLTNMNGGGGGHRVTKQKTNQYHTITPKQEAYAQALAGGMTQIKAYETAGYAVSNKTRKSIDECASVLAANPKVISRVSELRRPAVERAEVTVDYLISRLKDAVAIGEDVGSSGGMVAGLREMGKLSDLYPAEKQDINVSNDAITEALTRGRARIREIQNG